VASSRPLFIPPAAFAVFDGDGFTPSARCLHAHPLGGCYGGSSQWRTQIYASLSGGGMHWWRFLDKIYREWLQLRRVKNPKGFSFYL
jgi:hypothetical protein